MVLLEYSEDKIEWRSVIDHEGAWADMAEVLDDYETVCNGLIEGFVFKTHNCYYRKRKLPIPNLYSS
jgi:uridine kinase